MRRPRMARLTCYRGRRQRSMRSTLRVARLTRPVRCPRNPAPKSPVARPMRWALSPSQTEPAVAPAPRQPQPPPIEHLEARRSERKMPPAEAQPRRWKSPRAAVRLSIGHSPDQQSSSGSAFRARLRSSPGPAVAAPSPDWDNRLPLRRPGSPCSEWCRDPGRFGWRQSSRATFPPGCRQQG